MSSRILYPERSRRAIPVKTEDSVKIISNKPEFNQNRRTFLRYFPRGISAVYLGTTAAISAISTGTAGFLGGCALITGEANDRTGYPHPWKRDYVTKTVSYDKIDTLKKRGSRIKGTYVDWRQIIPPEDPTVRDELNKIIWHDDFGDERDILLSLLHHISAKKSFAYIEQIRKRIGTNVGGGCKELTAMLGSLSIASGVAPEKLAFISGHLYRYDRTNAHSWVGYKYTQDKLAVNQLGIDFFLNSSGILYYTDPADMEIFKPAKKCGNYYHYNIQSCYDGSVKEFLWPEQHDVQILKKSGYVVERAK
ncbi:hypothetical protein H8E88_00970 [candidate division KSB1 bacterium]|nr:hypothetical protein [candidate division KSB1 bacterium]